MPRQRRILNQGTYIPCLPGIENRKNHFS